MANIQLSANLKRLRTDHDYTQTKIAKMLNISKHQLSYVTNSPEGCGLMYYGNVLIPFKDKFDKKTKLYQLMTTKPEEVKEER